MGRESTKQRVILSAALSRRSLQRVLRGNSPVTIKSLSVLGESEALILRNIIKLVERKGSVRVLKPRLTLGAQSAKLLRAILSSTGESVARRRLLGRILSSVLQNTQLSKPAVETVALLKTVSELRATGKSLRMIAKETGVSKNTVMRILNALRKGKQKEGA